jgi:hypothetical protein
MSNDERREGPQRFKDTKDSTGFSDKATMNLWIFLFNRLLQRPKAVIIGQIGQKRPKRTWSF